MEDSPKRSLSPIAIVRAHHESDDDKYPSENIQLSMTSPISRIRSPGLRAKVAYVPDESERDPLESPKAS